MRPGGALELISSRFTRWGGAFVTAALVVAAASVASADPKLAPPWQEEIDLDVATADLPGVVVAVIHHDGPAWAHGAGASGDGHVPDASTPFAVGSLTKSATAVAILQLAEQGKLALDEPVISYLPSFSVGGDPRSSEITVRHLLQQTSGIPGEAGFEVALDVTARLQALASSQRIATAPGTTFTYSNANYDVLGALIERLTERPWNEVVLERVFAPLGAKCVFGTLDAARDKGLGPGHQDWFGVRVARAPWAPPTAAGGLFACAADWIEYVRAHMVQDPRLLRRESYELLHRPAQLQSSSYAMGWSTREVGGRSVLLHNGATPGFSSTMLFSREGGDAVVVFASIGAVPWPFASQTTRQLAAGALMRLDGKTPPREGFVARRRERLAKWVLLAGLLVGAFVLVRRARAMRRPGANWPRPLVFAGSNAVVAGALVWFVPHAVGIPLRALHVYAPDLASALDAGALLGVLSASLGVAAHLRTRGQPPT